MNVAMEEDVGVMIGSMWRLERRRKGEDVDNKGGRVECNIVIGRREVGHKNEGRARSEGRRARGPAETGVRIKLCSVNFRLG